MHLLHSRRANEMKPVARLSSPSNPSASAAPRRFPLAQQPKFLLLQFTRRPFIKSGKMRAAPPSLRSYSFLVFGFCLIFLIFGYRSLRSNHHKSSQLREDYEYEGEENELNKLLKARCTERKNLERLGEYQVCQAKSLNKERNCLLFSVSTSSNLKFEDALSEQLDKCKLHVYDHEGKTTVAEDTKYKAIERIEADQLTEKHLPKIFGAEKKGKVHLLRLQAGKETPKLAQSKLLKERQVCHLLLTLEAKDEKELGDFANKMKQSHDFHMYAASPLREDGQQDDPDEDDEEEDKEDEEEETKNEDKAERKKFALSFVAKGCMKSYGLKAI